MQGCQMYTIQIFRMLPIFQKFYMAAYGQILTFLTKQIFF